MHGNLIILNNGAEEDGHVSTEICTQCGRIARTSINHHSKSPARRGNHNSDQHMMDENGNFFLGADGELVLIDIAAEECERMVKEQDSDR